MKVSVFAAGARSMVGGGPARTVGQGNPMANRRISRGALEQLVLERLKAAPGCNGARSVVVVMRSEGDTPSNWRVGMFDSGTASSEACRRALASIENRLANDFTAVDDG
jgi:hypothetical protein